MKLQTSRETDLSEALSRRAFVTHGLGAAGLSGMGLSADAAAASATVSTMTGPVPCGSLGTTLIHEHILWFGGPKLTDPGYTPIPNELRSESVEFAVTLLNDAARAGIDTLVDLTPHRPIDLYQQIAKRTFVKIIPSTGFYRRQKIPKWMADTDDEKQMENRMLKEVIEGIDGTSVRSGIIKVASEGTPLTDWEKRVFRAAARVQKTTGIAIATHSGSASAGEQYDLLVRTGGIRTGFSYLTWTSARLATLTAWSACFPSSNREATSRSIRLARNSTPRGPISLPFCATFAMLASLIDSSSRWTATGTGRMARGCLKEQRHPRWTQMLPKGLTPT